MLTLLSSGSSLNLLIWHQEYNIGVLPSSSILKIYTTQVANPYWIQVGGDYDVLTLGGVVGGTTGLYGLNINTSAYSPGQYSVYFEWTYGGNTYTETNEFVINQDVNVLDENLKDIKNKINTIIVPTRLIQAIAETLGIKLAGEQQNAALMENIVRLSNVDKTIKDMSTSIPEQLYSVEKEASNARRKVIENSNKLTNQVLPQLKKELSDFIKTEIEKVIKENKNDLTLINQDQKAFNLEAFDLNARMTKADLQKIDYMYDFLRELSMKMDSLNESIPQQVNQINEQTIGQMASRMILGNPQNNTFGGQNGRQ